jgi:hypothetical protein
MSTDSGITKRVLEFVQNKEEITASEIAAFIMELAREDLAIDEDEHYKKAVLGKSVLWRGASSFARDIIKRPRVVEEILNDEADEDSEEQPDEVQGELFAGLGAFVRVDTRDGTWRYKRRRMLSQEEYRDAMALLRTKSRQISEKIERYQTEYDAVLPFWTSGLTFGEAVQLASERG